MIVGGRVAGLPSSWIGWCWSGYFGARLAKGGADVVFIARGPHLEAMRKHGLRIENEREMADEAENSAVATRLRRMPGIGPVTAMAIETFVPRWRTSDAVATSLPGSGSCRASIPAAANRDWGGPRKWGSATSGDC